MTIKISKFIKPERTSPKKSPDCEKDLSLIVSMGENRPVYCVPTDPRENRNLLSKLIHSEPGVGEKPPIDGGNHPSGQLFPLPSIRSSLPVGRLERQPVPVPRSLRSSHPTPLSRWRNTSEILDFFGVDIPSFLQQQHRFPRSGRCVFVCLSCHVDYGRKTWNRGFI